MSDPTHGPGGPNGHACSEGKDEMPCPRLVELLTEYIEQALNEDEQTRFEAHLSRCPGCVVFVDQMRETIRTLGRVKPQPVSPAVKARLIEIYRDLRGGGSS